MAFEPSQAYWDAAFALADALDKSDPARAELAPVRTRLNLLTSATGARLEADLWPHLKGLTAGIYGEPGQPGRPTGGMLILHVDSDSTALRLVSHTLPHLAKLVPRGQDVAFWRSGQNVVVTWGNGVATGARAAAADTKLSVAPRCTDWEQAGKPAPERLGVFWPARCWPLKTKATAKSAAWCALEEDPPVVWWGWTRETTAIDSVRWPSLEVRVRRFLEQIELEAPPER
jgi:hypothetical protein